MVAHEAESRDPLNTRIAIAKQFGDIAVAAGREILRIRAGALAVRSKADSSPVTEADELAEVIIIKALRSLYPDLPVVAEEAVAAGDRPVAGGQFLLVDPLDGTREFVAGLDEFTVNIAMISAGAPVAGAVYAPASGELWCGATGADGSGKAWKCPVVDPAGAAEVGAAQTIRARAFHAPTSIAVVSRAFDDARAADFVRSCGVVTARRSGSSIKFCHIAEGHADIYPRFGPTNEWDIAAGDAVLRAAGGVLLQQNGEPLRYGNPRFASPFFVAFGDCAAAKELIANAAG